MVVNALQDSAPNLVLAYGRHPVAGTLICHDTQTLASSGDKQVTILQALGEGEWDACESLYYAGEPVDANFVHFHPGKFSTSVDPLVDPYQAVDSFFPAGITYNGTAYVAVRLPAGMADENDPSRLKGIFRCLKVNDYDASGNVTGFSWSNNPARVAADLIIKRAGLPTSRVNWAKWVAWRDYCDQTISWNDGTSTRSIKRFEAHVFFANPVDLDAALDLLCLISCSDWQDVDGQITFLTPEARTPVFAFTESNIKEDSFSFYEKDRRERPTKWAANYRNADDAYLGPESVDSYRTSLSDALGQENEPSPLELGGMTKSQAERVLSYQMRLKSDLTTYCELTAGGTSFIVAPGDVVTVTHSLTGWAAKQFLVITATDESSETTADERSFILQEYNSATYSDTDHTPLQKPSSTPLTDSPFAAPSAPTSITFTQRNIVNDDGTVNHTASAVVQFGTSYARQSGQVYWQRPGDSGYTYLCTIEPNPADLKAGFVVETLMTGSAYSFKVIPISDVGVQGTQLIQSFTPSRYVGTVRAPISAGRRMDGARAVFTWTASGDTDTIGYNVYNGASLLGFTQSTYWSESAVGMSGTVTRTVKAVNSMGTEGTALSVTFTPSSDVAVPSAPTVNATPFSKVTSQGAVFSLNYVSDPDQFARIAYTIFDVADNSGFTVNLRSEMKPGPRSETTIVGLAGATVYVRARYVDIFGRNTANCTTQSVTLKKLGDSNGAVGNLWFETDNTYDVGKDPSLYGAAANRPRYVYAGTAVIAPLVWAPLGRFADLELSDPTDVTLTFKRYDDLNPGAAYPAMQFQYEGSRLALKQFDSTGYDLGSLLEFDATFRRWTSFGAMRFDTDNTYDIGANGAYRPRTVYVGTSVIAGGNVTATNMTASAQVQGLSLRTASAGSGYMTMRIGGAGQYGFLEWFSPAGVRGGYFGYGNASGVLANDYIQLALENVNYALIGNVRFYRTGGIGFNVDNGYDIGSSNGSTVPRPHDVFIGNQLIVSGLTTLQSVIFNNLAGTMNASADASWDIGALATKFRSAYFSSGVLANMFTTQPYPGGVGYMQMRQGGASQFGFLEWYTAGGQRGGYLGYGNASGVAANDYLQWVFENINHLRVGHDSTRIYQNGDLQVYRSLAVLGAGAGVGSTIAGALSYGGASFVNVTAANGNSSGTRGLTIYTEFSGQTGDYLRLVDYLTNPLARFTSSGQLVQGNITPVGSEGIETKDNIRSRSDIVSYQATCGAELRVKKWEETITLAAAANTSSATTVPANALILAVTGRVVTADGDAGVTSLSVGYAGNISAYAMAVTNAAGQTFKGTLSGVSIVGNVARPILVTPSAAPSTGTRGQVKIVVYYIDITPPTS